MNKIEEERSRNERREQVAYDLEKNDTNDLRLSCDIILFQAFKATFNFHLEKNSGVRKNHITFQQVKFISRI